MLLIKTNSKSSFSGADIPVFSLTTAEEALFNLGCSSWIETGSRYIRTDAGGRVTGLLDRANSDVLTPVGAAPSVINAGIPVLHFDSTPMVGGVDVFPQSNVQTIITVFRANLGRVGTIVGSQASDNKPLLVYVDTGDTAAVRYLHHYPDSQINSTKAVKGIGWLSSIASYNLPVKSAAIFTNGVNNTVAAPVGGSISTSANANKIAIGGGGVSASLLPGTFDFALSIVLPGIAVNQNAAALAAVNTYLAEFMAKLSA